MATAKEKQDNARAICLLVGFVVFIPLMIFSFIRYQTFKTTYTENEYSQRIFDIGNLAPAFITAGSFLLFAYIVCAYSFGSPIGYVLGPIALIGTALICVKIAQSIAATYFGVFVDPFNNRVLLPKDMANYSITDYFNLKFITDLGTMEQVPLDQIRKITRQGGKKLFIHGKFGSRGMTFSNKQKRDECISAIEDAARVSASLEFEDAA